MRKFSPFIIATIVNGIFAPGSLDNIETAGAPAAFTHHTAQGSDVSWVEVDMEQEVSSVADSDISAGGLTSIPELGGALDPSAPIAARRVMLLQNKLNSYKLRLKGALAA